MQTRKKIRWRRPKMMGGDPEEPSSSSMQTRFQERRQQEEELRRQEERLRRSQRIRQPRVQFSTLSQGPMRRPAQRRRARSVIRPNPIMSNQEIRDQMYLHIRGMLQGLRLHAMRSIRKVDRAERMRQAQLIQRQQQSRRGRRGPRGARSQRATQASTSQPIASQSISPSFLSRMGDMLSSIVISIPGLSYIADKAAKYYYRLQRYAQSTSEVRCDWPNLRGPDRQKYIVIWIADYIHDFWNGINGMQVNETADRMRYFLCKLAYQAFTETLDARISQSQLTGKINQLLADKTNHFVTKTNLETSLNNYFGTIEPLNMFDRHGFFYYDEILDKSDAEIENIIAKHDTITLSNRPNNTYKQLLELVGQDGNPINPNQRSQQAIQNRRKLTRIILQMVNNNSETDLDRQQETYFTFDALPINIDSIVQNTSEKVKALYTPQTIGDSGFTHKTLLTQAGHADAYLFPSDQDNPSHYTSKCLNYTMNMNYNAVTDYHIRYEKNQANQFSSVNRYGFTYVLYKGNQEVRMPFSNQVRIGPSQSYLCDIQDQIIKDPRQLPNEFPILSTKQPVKCMNKIAKHIRDAPAPFAKEMMKAIRNDTNPILMKIKQAGDQDQITAAASLKSSLTSVVMVTHDKLCALNSRLNCLNTIYEETNGSITIYRVSDLVTISEKHKALLEEEKERIKSEAYLRERYTELYNIFSTADNRASPLIQGINAHCTKFITALTDQTVKDRIFTNTFGPFVAENVYTNIIANLFDVMLYDITLEMLRVCQTLITIQESVNINRQPFISLDTLERDPAFYTYDTSETIQNKIQQYMKAINDSKTLTDDECIAQCKELIKASEDGQMEYFFLKTNVILYKTLQCSINALRSEFLRLKEVHQRYHSGRLRSSNPQYEGHIDKYNETIDNIFSNLYYNDSDELFTLHNLCRINVTENITIESELKRLGIIDDMIESMNALHLQDNQSNNNVELVDMENQGNVENERLMIEIRNQPTVYQGFYQYVLYMIGQIQQNPIYNRIIPQRVASPAVQRGGSKSVITRNNNIMNLSATASIFMQSILLHPVNKNNEPLSIPNIVSDIEKVAVYYTLPGAQDVVIEDLTKEQYDEIREYTKQIIEKSSDDIASQYEELYIESYYSDAMIRSNGLNANKLMLPVFYPQNDDECERMTYLSYQFYVIVGLAYINEKLEGRKFSILSNFFTAMLADYPLLDYIKTEIDLITAEKNAQNIPFEEWFNLFTNIQTQLAKEISTDDLPLFNKALHNTITPIVIPTAIKKPLAIKMTETPRSRIERPPSRGTLAGGKRKFRCTKRAYRPTQRHLTQKNLTK